MNSNPPLPTSSEAARIRRGRWILVLIFLLFFGTIFGAGVLRFSGWQPHGTKAHGEMLRPAVDARAVVPKLAGGGDYAWRPAERMWRIVVAPPADCASDCLKLAKDLDVVWQLFGNNADHVEILWIGPRPAGAPDTVSLRQLQPTPELLTALPRVNDPAGVPVYVIDPNGFVILRYAPGTDPGFIRTDVSKLLKLI
ncbi:hypothetical protein [Pseudoxanthomonas sacheonensis]|uniref:Thioredoxin domain-containing protein n=1 Tax=Pseudoxanthomonas sacheonensis TaxID=443615 RepID=A0ABU1RS84_9GAMM|nr:hypothetical protein [Pseudoxanthomonas sacheonensis]MDR6841629.1 hypothetical protein [Pseudoxanthomonas sacheonensis]